MTYATLPCARKGVPPATNSNPPIHCETCGRVRVHDYVGTGKIERKNVRFLVYGSGGIAAPQKVSGAQVGEIYQCQTCGTKRMFGSSTQLLKNAKKEYVPGRRYKKNSRQKAQDE
jgi:DNA-directed RNA polymerase subunit RPC12/RpoP